MEKNGQNLCMGDSLQINIRYFLVKYRFYKKDIEIFYCRTEVILSDYYTKLLHGGLFHIFREFIKYIALNIFPVIGACWRVYLWEQKF